MKLDRSIGFLPDIHCPDHHEPSVRAALALIREMRPATVVVLGDVIDNYQVSRFVKDPDRIKDLQNDMDAAAAVLRRVREAAPGSRLVVLCGNHERRLQTYIRTYAAALSSLRCLTVEGLLKLNEIKAEYAPSGQVVLADGGLLVKHGRTVRSKSGDTANAEIMRTGMSGVSGHTHRLAKVSRTTEAGRRSWVEAGCLCSLDLDHLEGECPDWQHGMAYAKLDSRGRSATLEAIEINNGRIVFGGREVAWSSSARRTR